MTEEIFREDAYAKQCQATVTQVKENSLCLDKTVFYPHGGGQLGDSGIILLNNGHEIRITDTRKGDELGEILHVTEDSLSEELVGSSVQATIDWPRRYRMMCVHSLLHLLGSIVPAGVTGGSIRDDGSGRLDFDIPESTLDKHDLTQRLNQLIEENHPVRHRWITDAELDASPELVRTMSVRPPRGFGQVRLLEIDGVDLQACGGTHVAFTGEIGPVEVRKIEKKGKHNRRVNVRLVSGVS